MDAVGLLRQRGAADIPHPGGSLLEHLMRVEQRLASYGASVELRRAGLMHAAYSTDGFDTALLGVGEREVLRAVIGPESEGLVYRYCATDRQAFYRQLGQPLVVWRDRFTGDQITLDPPDVAPLVELTVANELDVVEHSPDIRAAYGGSLHDLFTRARGCLSGRAWDDVVAILAAPAPT